MVHFDGKQSYWSFCFLKKTGNTSLAIMENTALCHVSVGTVF
jgi:hypothetical protein